MPGDNNGFAGECQNLGEIISEFLRAVTPFQSDRNAVTRLKRLTKAGMRVLAWAGMSSQSAPLGIIHATQCLSRFRPRRTTEGVYFSSEPGACRARRTFS